MWIPAAYLVTGLVICAAVALRSPKSGERNEFPLAMLFDPIWPLIFIWPLWVAIVLVEQNFPKTASSFPQTAPRQVGQLAIVVTGLRPMGRIRVGSEHFDARSDGRIIPEGAQVRIVSRSMAEYLVEEIPDKPSA